MKSTVLIGIYTAICIHKKIFYESKKDSEFIPAQSELETIVSILAYGNRRLKLLS